MHAKFPKLCQEHEFLERLRLRQRSRSPGDGQPSSTSSRPVAHDRAGLHLGRRLRLPGPDRAGVAVPLRHAARRASIGFAARARATLVARARCAASKFQGPGGTANAPAVARVARSRKAAPSDLVLQERGCGSLPLACAPGEATEAPGSGACAVMGAHHRPETRPDRRAHPAEAQTLTIVCAFFPFYGCVACFSFSFD